MILDASRVKGEAVVNAPGPGDIALTLNWLSTTDLRVSEIDDEFCSHVLIDQSDGSQVRVIEAGED